MSRIVQALWNIMNLVSTDIVLLIIYCWSIKMWNIHYYSMVI